MGTIPSFQPPPALIGTSPELDRQVALVSGFSGDPSCRPTPTLLALNANAEGTRDEVALKYPDAKGWRWRYRASQTRLVPLERLRLRDTGGILLGPLIVLVWMLGFLPVRWATRRMQQLQRGAA